MMSVPEDNSTPNVALIRSLMYLDGMMLRCKPDAILLREMRRDIGEFERLIK